MINSQYDSALLLPNTKINKQTLHASTNKHSFIHSFTHYGHFSAPTQIVSACLRNTGFSWPKNMLVPIKHDITQLVFLQIVILVILGIKVRLPYCNNHVSTTEPIIQ